MTAASAANSVGVVLVHGGFVDGSGWEDVYRILRSEGYSVGIVQNPTLSLSDDVMVFAASFAADVANEKAQFMADSQVPWGIEALSGTVSDPAWKRKPSWYLVATDDKMIPPDAQRAMSKRAKATVSETAGSHAVYVSRPEAVVAMIKKAVQAVHAASL